MVAKSFSLLVELRDKITGPLKGIRSPMKSFVAGANEAKDSLKTLNSAGRELNFAEKATNSLAALTPKLEVQRKKLDELKAKLASTNKSLASGADNAAYTKLKARIDNQIAAIDTLESKEKQYKTQLSATRQGLKKVGIETNDLTQARKQLTQRTDKARAADAKYKQSLESIRNIAPNVKRSLSSIKVGALATGATLAGMGYGMARLTGNLSKTAKDLTAASQAFNISTDKLQVWQMTGDSISDDLGPDKIKDIFKDVQDKVGDFSLTGGGEAKDFFEELKLDIKEFKNLAPDEIILKIGVALDKSKLTKSEKIFLLEGLANDASLLLPLLDDNAKALRNMQAMAKDANATLSKQDITTLLEAGKQAKELAIYWKGAKQQFGVAIADVWVKSNVSVILKDWLKAGTEFAKMKANSEDFKQFITELPGKLERGTTAAMETGREIVSFVGSVKRGVIAVKDFVGGWDNLLLGLVALKAASTVLTLGKIAAAVWGVSGASIVATKSMGLFTKGLGLAKTAALLLGRAALLNPIGLMVTGVAIAGYLLHKHWDKITQGAINFRNKIKGMSWPNIALLVTKGLVKLPAQLFKAGVDSVGQFTVGILRDWGVLDKATADKIKIIIRNFAGMPLKMINIGIDTVSNLVTGILSKKDELVKVVDGILQDIEKRAKAMLKSILNLPKKIKQGLAKLKNETVVAVRTRAGRAGRAISNTVNNVWSETKKILGNEDNSVIDNRATDNRVTNNTSSKTFTGPIQPADNRVTDNRATNNHIASSPVTDNRVTNNHIAGNPVTDNRVTHHRVTDSRVTNNDITNKSFTGPIQPVDNRVTDSRTTNNHVASNPVTDNRVTNHRVTDSRVTNNKILNTSSQSFVGPHRPTSQRSAITKPTRRSLTRPAAARQPQKAQVDGEITVKIEAPKGYNTSAKVKRSASQGVGITASVGKASW